jgi:hypothetical protein
MRGWGFLRDDCFNWCCTAPLEGRVFVMYVGRRDEEAKWCMGRVGCWGGGGGGGKSPGTEIPWEVIKHYPGLKCSMLWVRAVLG